MEHAWTMQFHEEKHHGHSHGLCMEAHGFLIWILSFGRHLACSICEESIFK